MPASVRILPYLMTSRSGKALATAFNTKRILNDVSRSKYRPQPNHFVINFGYNGVMPSWWEGLANNRKINNPTQVGLASDKVACFNILKEAQVPTPQFTTSQGEARTWLEEGAEKVYCRKLARGSQGRGIVVAHSVDELVSAPLYVRGVNIKREYRAHVFNGEVIDLVAKATRAGEEGQEANLEIRNHKNGWVFVRDAVQIPESVREGIVGVAISAVEALSLEMGAVDLIRDEEDNLYVLEINTAPGMEGTTLERYSNAIREWAEN